MRFRNRLAAYEQRVCHRVHYLGEPYREVQYPAQAEAGGNQQIPVLREPNLENGKLDRVRRARAKATLAVLRPVCSTEAETVGQYPVGQEHEDQMVC